MVFGTLRRLPEHFTLPLRLPVVGADVGQRVVLMRGDEWLLRIARPTFERVAVTPSEVVGEQVGGLLRQHQSPLVPHEPDDFYAFKGRHQIGHDDHLEFSVIVKRVVDVGDFAVSDRKSTRLNSSHGYISYAVFCLKKKKSY